MKAGKAGRAAAIALLGLIGSNVALAGDGNQLLTTCQVVIKFLDGEKKVDPFDIGYCTGIVEGVEGSIFILNDSLPANLKTCYPDTGINNGQKARIIVKYLRENPDQLHMPAAALAMIAYKNAYPCKR
ncbi:Rap1a/Tai family immunity protein [Pseudomonas sp. 18058]|uniref:Rap1a/Tai family immunity protein n=1 Tax=Pseudomonas sp. 18058 TaxID=2681406 RepID=UPI0013586F14|nr:Rap1a/Tai family immunity protein [Pseudomonas sp. 18058]